MEESTNTKDRDRDNDPEYNTVYIAEQSVHLDDLTRPEVEKMQADVERWLQKTYRAEFAEKEERQERLSQNKYDNHKYLFAVANDKGTFSYVQLAINYVRSGLFMVVLGHIGLYFAVMMLYLGLFIVFPTMHAYFIGLKFGEASFLVNFVISFLFNARVSALEETFKAQPRAATNIFHTLTELSDDVRSWSRIPTMPHNVRACMVRVQVALSNLTGYVLISFFMAEERDGQRGDMVMKQVRGQIGVIRENFRLARSLCDQAGIPSLLPDSFSQQMDGIRKDWVSNTLFRMHFRGNSIASMHSNAWVMVYLYTILPLQTYGALGIFSLVVYPMTMIIFNIHSIVYEYLRKPFSSEGQTRNQSDDFVKLEIAHRRMISDNLLSTLATYLASQ